MSHRDFVAQRSSKKTNKKGSNKKTLIAVASAVLIAFSGVLYFLKTKTPEEAIQKPVVQETEKQTPKSVLPNRPEEVWSYIKALETRTVPVDAKANTADKSAGLTEEQRQVLLQMEKDQKAAELAKKQAEQQAAKAAEQAKKEAAKAQEAEQAQAKKAEADAKKTAQPKVEATKKQETAKTESNKQPEKTATTAGGKRFGLQCGAFKNQAQAESLQARLAMTGLHAFIAKNGEWYRVRVGAFNDRNAAVQAQSKAKAVEDCVIIGM